MGHIILKLCIQVKFGKVVLTPYFRLIVYRAVIKCCHESPVVPTKKEFLHISYKIINKAYKNLAHILKVKFFKTFQKMIKNTSLGLGLIEEKNIFAISIKKDGHEIRIFQSLVALLIILIGEMKKIKIICISEIQILN